MIRFIKIIICICLVLLFKNGQAQNLFSYENSNKFARYLVNTQQYDLAAIEYARILNSNPADSVIFGNLIRTYRLGNQCENAFPVLSSFRINSFLNSPNVAKEFLKLTVSCECCFQENSFSLALKSISPAERLFFRLGNYINREQLDSVKPFISENYSELFIHYPLLLSTSSQLVNYKKKSPALAMAMSTILPGSGKAYSGYWGDALMSFIFVSSNAWISYRGFHKKGVKSATGWIFGSVTLGFYLGNIWGSGQAARSYNQIEYDKYYSDAKNSIYSNF